MPSLRKPRPTTRPLARRLPLWTARCCALVLVFCCAHLHAQTAATTGMGTTVDLTESRWLYQQGDNPAWKEPTTDDSAWPGFVPSVPSPEAFHCIGFCWYRLHVTVPKDSHNLGLALDNIDTNYQLFVNGVLIGVQGRMPPHPSNYMSNLTLYPIPNSQVSNGQLLVALRLWTTQERYPNEPVGGMQTQSHLQIGDLTELELLRKMEYANRFARAARDIPIGLLALLVGITALLLYRTQKDHTEYLWLFAMAITNVLTHLVHDGTFFDFFSIPFDKYAFPLILMAGFIANIEFVFRFLRRRTSLLFRAIEFAYIPLTPIVWYGVKGIPTALYQSLFILWSIPIDIMLPVLLIFAWRKGNREAGLLIFPTLLAGLTDVGDVLSNSVRTLWPHTFVPTLPILKLGPMSVSLSICFLVLTWLAFGLILINRSSAIVRERERIAGEIQAAKAVQDVLMPKLLSGTPGFKLESVYLPAQEVGGDFFHISPAPDGSLRLVIGDVSGKGLKAAMMVSLIIGALDRESSRDPASVLTGLNRMLAVHTTGGFTTCLCLNISTTGTLAAANAGHFAPYRNGEEIPMQGNLPLGLDPAADYAETFTHMQPGDHLLLFSDGIPEARNSRGELYGFDRTSAIIARHASAQDIATEAQAFGQEDDITVLELTRLPS